MEVAYELSPLVAFKLIVYTLGALVYLFLMVLILGNRWLRRLGWLLFWLIAALFMWNVGNLLSLNVGLFYGAAPAVLTRTSRLFPLLGLVLAAPLLVQVHLGYLRQFCPMPRGTILLSGVFCIPLITVPWMAYRLAGRLDLDPLQALGWYGKLLVAWLVAVLLAAMAVNGLLAHRRVEIGSGLQRMQGWLAGLEGTLALGFTWAYLLHPLPHQGLGGYGPTSLMLIAVVPGGLVAYSIFRYNLLDLRVQRSVAYSVAAIFGLLLYINFMRRLSSLLEAHGILPPAVTEAVMIFLLVGCLEPVKKLVTRLLHEAFVSEFEKVQKLATEIQEFAKESGDVESLVKYVEQRVTADLGLDRVSLVRNGKVAPVGSATKEGKVRWFPIHRGSEVIGVLQVTPRTSNLSGEQFGALELLADQLAPALEVCRLIADKIKLERELAEKARMAFLGDMAARIAHNVKNPLSSMKTLVQLLEQDPALPAGARQDCGMVINEIDRLNNNVSQLLRYAKQARDTDHPCDLEAVVRRVLVLSQAEADRLGVKMDCSIACASSHVEGGEEAASDIVSNLVVNALEATPAGRRVTVRIVPDGVADGVISLQVDDEGRGVAPEMQEKIFQPFFTTRPGGTGLGLAIVKRRAEEVGSAVECVSPLHSDGGARFVVKFRRAV